MRGCSGGGLRSAAWPSASAWRRARPAPSTSAAFAPRSSTGSSRATRAASSSSGSRTPTRAARCRARSTTRSSRWRWLGLDWDRPPTYQLDRFDDCGEAARKLVAEGKAYEDEGAIRFRMPDEGVTGWDDVVKGPIEFPNEQLEDLVILRSDGRPTYNFASPMEDVWDGITHVIRGDDHISNTPKQINIIRARGRRAARLRARAERARHRRQEALEAPRRAGGRRAARPRLRRAGADELPRPARLGSGRRDDDHVARRADRALRPRPRDQEPGRVRLREARLDERRLPPGDEPGGVRGRARRVPRRRTGTRRRSRKAAPLVQEKITRLGEFPGSPGSSSTTSSPTRPTSTPRCSRRRSEALAGVEPWEAERIEAGAARRSRSGSSCRRARRSSRSGSPSRARASRRGCSRASRCSGKSARSRGCRA